MPFDSLCSSKIFKDVPKLDEIRADPHMKSVFSTVFTGMNGRYTRMRIICAITERPMNSRELSKKLKLDYKTIQHNIKVLEGNSLITREGDEYGDVFIVSELITSNLPTLYKVIRKVEDKLDRPKKKYVD